MGFVNPKLRMAVILFSMLLLVELPKVFTSRLLETNECGRYHVSYSSGLESFYWNGKLLDKDSFCKYLKLYYLSHCFVPRKVRNQCHESVFSSGIKCCRLYGYFETFSRDGLHVVSGRRFLQNAVRNEASGKHRRQHDGTKDRKESMLAPKGLAVAGLGTLLLCCSLLCPCFHARRREVAHDVLKEDPSSMGSVSSVQMNSVSEKILGSPLRMPPSPSRLSMSPKLDRLGSVYLTMSQVARATQNFSPLLRLGEGGFATVYKAQLQDGQVVAIKRAKKAHFEALRTEFKSEVELLAKIEHRNLVKLLGYVDQGNERIIITEYVPNGTLREHLDGVHGGYLDFNQRLEISIDIAHALTYLHLYAEKQIIHRDVKSSNILLTESMRAKVADFGFARLGDINSDRTHVSTQVRGTIGYLDPEYMRTSQLTPKSDVYSFGVLLVEILTSRQPFESKRPPDEKVTIRWAFRKYSEGRVMELVDPEMKESVDEETLVKMLDLAIQCAAPTRSDRPDMKLVGEQLWMIRMEYHRSTRKV